MNSFCCRNFESRDSDDAEEKMAAAVLTSLSLSPVLKNFQVAKGRIDRYACIFSASYANYISFIVLLYKHLIS